MINFSFFFIIVFVIELFRGPSTSRSNVLFYDNNRHIWKENFSSWPFKAFKYDTIIVIYLF